ncbi:uncharacterized protein VTP21DRAFT_3915 [Calcarisporiella thermophila]|uniref:uncharacterized protein n=1 Tax=Calcarisporiella thermophila TaxID=911321 RepID=UPI003743555B
MLEKHQQQQDQQRQPLQQHNSSVSQGDSIWIGGPQPNMKSIGAEPPLPESTQILSASPRTPLGGAFDFPPDGNWRVVGSPSRRLSLQPPQEADELRSAAMEGGVGDEGYTMLNRASNLPVGSLSETSDINVSSSAVAPKPARYALSGGLDGAGSRWPSMPWGSSGIDPQNTTWGDPAKRGMAGGPLSPALEMGAGANDFPPTTMDPHRYFRQHRSLSLSSAQQGDYLGGLEPSSYSRSSYRQPLPAMEEEEDDDEVPQSPYELPKSRLRSKSSAAAYGIALPSHDYYGEEAIPGLSSSYRQEGLPSIWNRLPPGGLGRRSSIGGYHPSSPGSFWEPTTPLSPASSTAAAAAASYFPSSLAERERLDRMRTQRRYSLAPAPTYHDNAFLEGDEDLRTLSRSFDPDYLHLRRHSVAGPALAPGPNQAANLLPEALDSLILDETQRVVTPSAARLPGDPTRSALVMGPSSMGDSGRDASLERTNEPLQDLGKGTPLHALAPRDRVYVVEFKAGRTDFYYVPEGSMIEVRIGDLVIVEADRGQDLGKVTTDALTPPQVRQIHQQQQPAPEPVSADMAGSGGAARQREVRPKKIYRLADPNEVTMLMSKQQDEAKAMALCQTKVRQKNLPMEVVDAEYQWDRRKLTFYFVADRRIDFRELVRELFKVYKTRIWMCATTMQAKKK